MADQVNYSRISGLASGLDIDSMVKSMIKAESYRLNKYKQAQTKDEWKQDIYRTVNSDLGNFIVNTRKDLGLSSTTATGININKSISSVTWVNKTTVSDETVLTATANGDAAAGKYSVNVTQLATGVTAASSKAIVTSADPTVKVGTATKLSEINGINITGSDTITFYINGKEISGLTGDSTVQDLLNKVNQSGAGIKMTYDSGLGRFFIATTSTGSSYGFQVTSDANRTTSISGTKAENLFNALSLNINRSDGTVVTGNADNLKELNNGTDAIYDFAGATGLTSSSNQVTVNGINMDFKKTGSVTVSVETDIDTIVTKIKKFFEEDYNKLLDGLYAKINEKADRDYQPLTDDQKEAMKDDDIKKWEDKAKQGLLQNDPTISSMLYSIRDMLYEPVSGVDSKYNTLYKIGIETKSYFDGGKPGQIEIDEAKLRQALIENPDAVMSVLFKNSDADYTSKSLTSSERSSIKEQTGIVGRIYNEIIFGIKGIVDQAGYGQEEDVLRSVRSNIFIDFVTERSSISYLSKDITDLKKRIADEQDSLKRKEDMYYQKFTAMEKAISQMNSQSAWLAQQFGTGQ